MNLADATTKNWTKETSLKSYAKQMRLRDNANGKLELVFISPNIGQLYSTIED